MAHHRPSATLFALVLSVAGAAVAPAQERIDLRVVPTPNQVIRTRSMATSDMRVEPVAGAAALPMALAITTTMRSAGTMDVGLPDKDGRMQARFTVTEFSNEATMNDTPMPVPAGAIPDVLNRTMTITYGADGAVTDVSLGTPSNPMLDGFAKGIASMAMAQVPNLTLAVGESKTTSGSVTAPGLPAGGTSGATTNTTYTLTSVSQSAAGRIAHVRVQMAGQVKVAGLVAGLPGGAGALALSGEGTMAINLDKGYVQRQEQTMTLGMQGGPDDKAVAPVSMKGTITTASEAGF